MINTVNPGDFKYKIKFFKNAKSVDEDGFKTSSLTEFLTTKCSIIDDSYVDSRRSTKKTIDSSSVTVSCIVRYDSRIDKNCIVEIDGQKHRIKSFANKKRANKFLELVLLSV